MCGIVGFISKEKNKEQIIKKMTERIIHRGPDDGNFYTDEFLALGHRRLSIIDLENGTQPMYDVDKSLVIVFNGEIYNYLELKEKLKEKYKFKTNSDTEVLIYGYKEWAKDLPKHLRGMFSLVIYDINNKTLFCARDHFGIKPFYYYKNQDVFMFASEIKAFLEHPEFNKVLNTKLISPYLCFGFTPTSETLFKNVFNLDPGHYLFYENEKLEIKPYFNLNFIDKNNSFDVVVKNIEDIMKDSIEHHMLSDVEVGSFLSSGVDSSYVVSLAHPKKTYTVEGDISKYNEISYAKDLTDKLNICNKSRVINKQDYISIVPKIMYHLDEPLADASVVALYFVSELASNDVKVVLSGEGADEFFGGYAYYRSEFEYSFYNKIPLIIRKLISKVCTFLPEFQATNFLIQRGKTTEESYIAPDKIFSEREVKKAVRKQGVSNKNITKPIFDKFKNNDDVTKKQALDINLWLVRDILHKADRMTMANSIESRTPFVDIEVFKVANTLSKSHKVSKETTKLALREASKSVIPNESYKKKKLGFPIPIRDWMKDDDVYKCIKLAFEEDFVKEFFDKDYIIKLLDDHKNNKKDNYKKVWAIYSFVIWYKIYFVEN